jgi:mannose-1-phosphate guanylyltransferase/mannose-6-phosphate isomerase
MINVTPVILCGGSGTRLWPLSRAGFPKQFLSLTGRESLFQQAAQRLVGLVADDIQVAKPIIVTGEEHRFLASEQLREVGIELGAALLEPVGRNTAPALTLAALAAQVEGDDPVLVVTPADQTLVNTTAFTQAMQQAIREASGGSIVILGVTPDRPEAGYGYIQAQVQKAVVAMSVQCFVEKPNVDTAQQYINEGGYYWNAGMFVLKASVWLNALEQFRPDILQATQAAWGTRVADNLFVRPGKAEFAAIPSESVDYAAIEHCPGSNFPIKMVPCDVVVRVDTRYFRPTEVETLLGDPSKAKRKLGWTPEISVQEMCKEMVASDLEDAKRHSLLKANGYLVNVSVES